MRIAVVQFNPRLGALRQNCQRALAQIEELACLDEPPDLVVFPAFALTGAPLEGLCEHRAFALECVEVAQHFCAQAELPTLIGTVLPASPGKDDLSAWFAALEAKLLPCGPEVLFACDGQGDALGFNTDVGPNPENYQWDASFDFGGHKLTVILNGLVYDEENYGDSELIITLLSKPYKQPESLLAAPALLDKWRVAASEHSSFIVVANLCGAADGEIFEGSSLVLSPTGEVEAVAPAFVESCLTVELDFSANSGKNARPPASRPDSQRQDKQLPKLLAPYQARWQALSLMIADYLHKNDFSAVVLGLSGGIDSAVTATLACDALGSEHVHGLLLPSPNSSPESLRDARELAAGLGMQTYLFPLDRLFATFQEQSQQLLGSAGSGLAIQNLQARLRTVILMHFSNTYDWLLLNTGNKSEAAMGYSTLYGDTAGIMAPLGNVYKTDVYGLARWRNSQAPVIPVQILTKPPSAELYPGQKDTDSLPDYQFLDRILNLHVEEGLGLSEILEKIDATQADNDALAATVADILRRVQAAEFKRRQEPWAAAADGTDFTEQRAWPISNAFVDRYRRPADNLAVLKQLAALYENTGKN